MAEASDECGLMVVVEAAAGSAASVQLAAALDAAAVATVLIVPGVSPQLDAPALKALIELVQARGIAALIHGDAQAARTLKADGVHMPASRVIAADLGEAREVLGRRFIVGADAGRSRDDAMTIGEQGADYVAFGVPPEVQEQDKARERRLDLVAWWAEIFEVPCVALDVADAEEAAALAEAGADFVAVHLAAGMGQHEARERVAAFAEAIAGRRLPPQD